jgi:hypothetical protein
MSERISSRFLGVRLDKGGKRFRVSDDTLPAGNGLLKDFVGAGSG